MLAGSQQLDPGKTQPVPQAASPTQAPEVLVVSQTHPVGAFTHVRPAGQ